MLHRLLRSLQYRVMCIYHSIFPEHAAIEGVITDYKPDDYYIDETEATPVKVYMVEIALPDEPKPIRIPLPKYLVSQRTKLANGVRLIVDKIKKGSLLGKERVDYALWQLK